MAINLTALSKITTTATALSNLILVNPQEDAGIQPQILTSESRPPPKFLFNYYGEQTVALESDITDHYVEDNTALQDQISLKPVLITGHGFIGELNDIVPDFLKFAKTIRDKLTVISAYTPGVSVTALNAYNTAVRLYATQQLAQQAAVSAWNFVAGGDGVTSPINGQDITNPALASQNKQQRAFQMFYGYYRQRRLFTVQTPWAIFQNCAIKSLRAIQSEETNMISEFEIVFKPIQFAKTISVGVNVFGQARNGVQSQEGSPVFLGDSVGEPVTQSQADFYNSSGYAP